MTSDQFYIAGLFLLIALNLIISGLNNKYRLRKDIEEKKLRFDNDSAFSNTSPGGYMLRIPFLILYRSKTTSLRRLILLHNVLAIIFYLILATIIYCDYKKNF